MLYKLSLWQHKWSCNFPMQNNVHFCINLVYDITYLFDYITVSVYYIAGNIILYLTSCGVVCKDDDILILSNNALVLLGRKVICCNPSQISYVPWTPNWNGPCPLWW